MDSESLPWTTSSALVMPYPSLGGGLNAVNSHCSQFIIVPGFVRGVALLGQSINIFMPLSNFGRLKSGIQKIDNFALFNSGS
jgi:hypothetical protein